MWSITYHGNTSVAKGSANTCRTMLKLGGKSCDSTEQACKDDASDPELGTTTNLVIGSRSSNSTSGRNNRVGKGEEQSALNGDDAKDLVHGREVVSQDGVSRQLSKEGHEGHHGETPAGVVVLDKRPVVPQVGRLLQLDRFFEFAQLELDNGVVGVAAAVILGQDCSSLFLLTRRGEPSRRFGDEKCADENEEGGNELETHGETEGQFAVVLGRGICDSGGENGTGVED